MPNHCHNRVTFYGSGNDTDETREQIAKLKEIFEGESIFPQFIPEPDWPNTPLTEKDIYQYSFSKASGLVPAKKPAAKKSGKAGRIVGISKDENEYIQEVLHMIADDPELGASNPNYVKIQARYNK